MIEVMIAIFVLAVALMALASVSLSTLDSLRDTRDREQATNAASSAIEDVRSRDFADIALAPDTVDPDALPDGTPLGVATTSCFGLTAQPDGERLVVDSVDNPVPFEQTAGDDGAYTVHTLVTYDGVDCATTDRSALKRITAIVSWADGGSGEVLVETSTVTDVDRGLPVPRFEVRPPQGTVRFSEAFLTDTDEDPYRRCSEHVLRNLGAEDSYDWEVVGTSAGGAVSLERTHESYDVDGWRYTAYLEPNPDEIEREAEPPQTHEYRFADESAFPRLVSDLRLGSGESALLTVCAEPSAASPDLTELPDEVEVDVLVRSRFDERVEREVTLTVRIADSDEDPAPGEPLYLFDHDDSGPHERYYEPEDMGPLADADDSDDLVSHLTTHKYEPADADWSTDVVPDDDIAGKRLLVDTSGSTDPQVDDHTAAWHFQFGSKTTLEPDATLVLWTAPAYVFKYSLGNGEIPLAFDVRVDELKSNETAVGGWESVSEVEYRHTTPDTASSGGWEQVKIPIDLGAEREFANNRYIRVRVTCVPADDTVVLDEDDMDDDHPDLSDCNLAYDNEDLASALYIQVR